MIALARKPCRKCGEEKPLTDFTTDPRYRDGRINTCKLCANAAHRAVYAPRFKSGQTQEKKERPTDFDLGLSILSTLAKPGVELTLGLAVLGSMCGRLKRGHF